MRPGTNILRGAISISLCAQELRATRCFELVADTSLKDQSNISPKDYTADTPLNTEQDSSFNNTNNHSPEDELEYVILEESLDDEWLDSIKGGNVLCDKTNAIFDGDDADAASEEESTLDDNHAYHNGENIFADNNDKNTHYIIDITKYINPDSPDPFDPSHFSEDDILFIEMKKPAVLPPRRAGGSPACTVGC